jgi:hypothetical protein
MSNKSPKINFKIISWIFMFFWSFSPCDSQIQQSVCHYFFSTVCGEQQNLGQQPAPFRQILFKMACHRQILVMPNYTQPN